jgi:hypothetical protein
VADTGAIARIPPAFGAKVAITYANPVGSSVSRETVRAV